MERTNKLSPFESVFKYIYELGKNKYQSLKLETLTTKQWKELKFDESSIVNIQKELNKAYLSKRPNYKLSSDENIIKEIKSKTKQLNVNNITRTKAYFDFYIKHPEIHWAFLAHMVSRNGGWNMTDLKGSLLNGLLETKEKDNFFLFLEKANWTIFNDAFPQLLLYERSKLNDKSYFHLLPHFNVSLFMTTLWEAFYHCRNSQLLTVSLIINEQQHLEQHVMKKHNFMENILNSWEYKLQELFQLTQVVFPYGNKKKNMSVGRKKSPKLY
ncbi:MAG: DUF2515 domain-containing protein [Bacillus sp. (in: Bacteria)]|nr:DUF2515 domain-containing protein [Bacillus sp. (in: firmicutes)]